MAKECLNLPEWKNLPDDCWELIFYHLPSSTYFNPLSLVCKQFLFITNRLRFKLSVADSEILIDGNISKLINRFPHLTSVDFSYLDWKTTDLALLGNAIACLLNVEEINISNKSEIPIWGFKNIRKSLRVLKCNNLDVLRDTDLVAIANSLPVLEELDISEPKNCNCNYSGEFPPVTDAGIKVLAANLESLRRINVSSQHFITAESLVCLSVNCRYLEEIKLNDSGPLCSYLKSYGILSLIRNNANLRSISVDIIDLWDVSSDLVFEEDSVITRYGRQCLESLEITCSLVSDEFLYLLARANLPLRRLSFTACNLFEVTLSGLSSLLHSCKSSLEEFEFGDFEDLTDESFREYLSPYLHNLVAIKLYGCPGLTISTFYVLAETCPLLQDIEMVAVDYNFGDEETCSSMEYRMNKYTNIKSLNLSSNCELNDECLKRFTLILPKLEKIDVSASERITEEGIADVLDTCPQLRSLKCGHRFRMKTIREGSELPNLREVDVPFSDIKDGALATIGKRCPGLSKLNLKFCKEVTTRGVEEVLRQCKSLAEINLKYCTSVNLNDLDWTLVSRSSSLRKILVELDYCSIIEKELKNLFLPRGFRVIYEA